MYSQKIGALLAQALQSLTIETDDIPISQPQEKEHGDYSSTVALVLAQKTRQNPVVLAQKIVNAIPQNDIVESAFVVKPGFINIFLREEILIEYLHETKSFSALALSPYSGKRITVEFTDPNPFKIFHIGHLFSNTIGESVSRLLESVGAQVRRVCYQGDVGIHVACSLWGMIATKQIEQGEWTFEKPVLETIDSAAALEKLHAIEALPLAERVSLLGRCYAYGATAFKDDEQAKAAIQALNPQIFLAAQHMWLHKRPDFKPVIDYQKRITVEVLPIDLVKKYYESGREWTLSYFETIYHRLGTTYREEKDYYFESFVGEKGYEIVAEGLQNGIFTESNGAVVFRGEDYGLHTRVFINSLGLPTYETKEIGLNPTKYADWPFDISIIVTGNEIEDYFRVVLKALSLLKPEIAKKTKHIPHGMVRIPQGKMSSRTGNVKSGEGLLDEVKEHLIHHLIESKREGKGEKTPGKTDDIDYPLAPDFNKTAEAIALAAVKYSFLKSNIGKDIVFNFDESLSFEGDSGPYLLYTIVRCKSILAKAKNTNYELQTRPERSRRIASIELQDVDRVLLRHLVHYPEVITQAAAQYAPHLVCTYLHKLAQEFNTYYSKAPILTSATQTRAFRLALVTKVEQTLIHGIRVLGFEEVEKM